MGPFRKLDPVGQNVSSTTDQVVCSAGTNVVIKVELNNCSN